MKPFQGKSKILDNRSMGGDYYSLTLECKAIAAAAKPGQFAMLKAGCGTLPLLRRPLGVHKTEGGKVTFVYEVKGEGTKLLSRKRRGELVDIIGPLGTGFNFSAKRGGQGMRRILVAGGMGVAPLLFLAKKMAGGKSVVLLGAKTKNQLLCEKEFKSYGCEVRVATDDGSRGFKGYVTELLRRELSTPHEEGSRIYACGPDLMLKAARVLAKAYFVPLEVSLEAHMACGIGACLGCVVETRHGFARVCKEGPVFDAAEILWK